MKFKDNSNQKQQVTKKYMWYKLYFYKTQKQAKLN